MSGIPDLRNLAGSKVKDCTDLVAVDHLNSVSGVSGFRMLAQLKIRQYPELEELRLGHLSFLEYITIEGCSHLKYLCFSGMKCMESITFQKNVMVKYFELDDCQKLKTMQFGCKELVELSIRGCPELKELPDFTGLSWLERIVIDERGKSEYLKLHRCRNLKSVSVNSKIRWLTIRGCPQLEELPNLSRVIDMEKIEIYQCAKIQHNRLPTTLISLSVQTCKDLLTVVETDDLLELRKLIISNCPELEEFPSLSRMSCLEQLVIDSCEKLQNIGGIEEFHASEYMKLSYCSSALIRNCIHKLRVMISPFNRQSQILILTQDFLYFIIDLQLSRHLSLQDSLYFF